MGGGRGRGQGWDKGSGAGTQKPEGQAILNQLLQEPRHRTLESCLSRYFGSACPSGFWVRPLQCSTAVHVLPCCHKPYSTLPTHLWSFPESLARSHMHLPHVGCMQCGTHCHITYIVICSCRTPCVCCVYGIENVHRQPTCGCRPAPVPGLPQASPGTTGRGLRFLVDIPLNNSPLCDL